ncbi:hypothetical protein D3C80_1335090 [compost metagenome]
MFADTTLVRIAIIESVIPVQGNNRDDVVPQLGHVMRQRGHQPRLRALFVTCCKDKQYILGSRLTQTFNKWRFPLTQAHSSLKGKVDVCFIWSRRVFIPAVVDHPKIWNCLSKGLNILADECLYFSLEYARIIAFNINAGGVRVIRCG